MRYDPDMLLYYYEDIITKSKKENDMRLDDVKVIIGDKVYKASGANYEQTIHEYPRIEVDAYLAPYYCVGKYNPPIIIKDVIFNPPATIVFWSDNTKTVVKADTHSEQYDPEKGLAMAISKKLMGDNKYEYYNTFLHWLKKWDKHVHEETVKYHETMQAMAAQNEDLESYMEEECC